MCQFAAQNKLKLCANQMLKHGSEIHGAFSALLPHNSLLKKISNDRAHGRLGVKTQGKGLAIEILFNLGYPPSLNQI